MDLCAPAPGAALEHVGVVEQAVEERRDGGGVAEQLAAVVDGAVGREQRRGAFVAAHDHLEQILAGGVRELAHPEIVDDEQWHRREIGEESLARAVESGVGDLFDEAVRLAVDDAVGPAGSRRGRSLERGDFSPCPAGRGRARLRAA